MHISVYLHANRTNLLCFFMVQTDKQKAIPLTEFLKLAWNIECLYIPYIIEMAYY